MFNNIGKKIKVLARILCYVGMAIPLIAGITMAGGALILPLLLALAGLAVWKIKPVRTFVTGALVQAAGSEEKAEKYTAWGAMGLAGIGVLILLIEIFTTRNQTQVGIIVTLAGTLAAWISTFLLYGYGDLVDNSQRIREADETNSELLRHLGGRR